MNKELERAIIANDISVFIASGGCITFLPANATGLDPLTGVSIKKKIAFMESGMRGASVRKTTG